MRSGALTERQQAARSFIKHRAFKDVTLIVDSGDFRLEKRDNRRAKSPWWSVKERSHAARYQFIISPDQVIRYWDGYFYPKDYDAHCLEGVKKDLYSHFSKGDVIMGDDHCRVLSKTWKEIEVRRRLYKHEDPPGNMTRETYSYQFSATRSVVEGVIGDLKKRFHLLKVPYRKQAESQKEVVAIVVGVHNWLRVRTMKRMRLV